MIFLIYLSWVPVALLAFKFAPLRYAPWISLLGGWVLLPPAVYPMPPNADFPFWLIGSSLPSDVLLNKVWVAPVATGLGSILIDARRWRHTSFNVWDACIAAFCLWPIFQEMLLGRASPAGWISSLYLVGSWGLPWWLGRLYLRSKTDVESFAAVFSGVILLLFPIAILEGVSEIRIHTPLFGEHPFAADGVTRYLGYRPQGMFENGNQYGLWCTAAAVTALWLVRQSQLSFGIAVVLAAMALASQSVGAIALLLLGALIIGWSGSIAIVVRFGTWVVLFAVITATLMIAGLLPLREFVEQSGAGQALLDAIRSTGRGSFAWRISQDLKAAPLLREHLLIGHGHWDWFVPLDSRPWGFPLLIIGQFGLVGLVLLLLPLMRAFSNALRKGTLHDEAAKLTAAMMIIAGIDAALNSFLLWPFVVVASPFAVSQANRPSTNWDTDPKRLRR